MQGSFALGKAIRIEIERALAETSAPVIPEPELGITLLPANRLALQFREKPDQKIICRWQALARLPRAPFGN